MSSQAVPDSLAQVHTELDLLAMRSLELSQELVLAKLRLEQHMREGFLLMAKARYSNGSGSVSVLQVPKEDSTTEFEANVRLVDQECLRVESNVRIRYLSVLEEFSDDDKSPGGLTHRKGQVVSSSSSSSSSPNNNKKKQNHDPLRWFGVLVPQTLKQSASSFGRGLEVVVESVNVQNEIQGVLARQKFLRRLKVKMEKEREERKE